MRRSTVVSGAYQRPTTQRQFVGTESRLMMVFERLRQVHGTEVDPEVRLAELQRQQDAIAAEMQRRTGSIREVVGFQSQLARERQTIQG